MFTKQQTPIKKIAGMALSAGLLAGIIAANKIAPAQAQSSQYINSFNACAANETRIRNTSRFSNIRVIAEGTWTGGGANPIHSAAGSPRRARHTNRLPCPECQAGTLLSEREGSIGKGGGPELHLVGTDATLFWPNGQVHSFFMNDYGSDDNRGCLRLHLYGVS
ncbi:MAG: hypothetical protein AAFN40_15080 [Cyanobacteria bacterium J06560_6]